MIEYKVESVPEGLEDHYKEQDGAFVLDLDGYDVEPDKTDLVAAQTELSQTKTKLKQFRETNTSLMKQINEGGGTVNDDFQVDIDSAIGEALKPIKEKNEKLLADNSKLQSTLEEVVLSDKVKDIAITHGVAESALSDVVSRAKNVFTVKDGKTIPRNKKNLDSDGNPMNTETWLKGLTETAPHLFKTSNGSGAQRPMNGHIQGERTSAQKIADGLNKL